ncbi:hypothetical protein [Ornithinimicrobium pekingense]|uniref:Uncharacterized protein n=1 Tax=Ornithinimicrobium pekingense TaxID=384677 RepID=A0ABQ2F7L6_9MICO|nr:hypothetical protein [Ornithinimicrobium pekingense]GGK69144.1 hypothetical protein GCM10011509_16950 [Ornithinimicrobium pekingense]
MNTRVRTRLLAVVGAGTVAGLLAGTGIAYAGHGPAPQAGAHPTVVCGSVQPGEQAEGRGFGPTHHVAL